MFHGRGEPVGEGCNPLIRQGRPEAKAPLWGSTDVDMRKRGEQTGLETPVVHAVNEGCPRGEDSHPTEQGGHPTWRLRPQG